MRNLLRYIFLVSIPVILILFWNWGFSSYGEPYQDYVPWEVFIKYKTPQYWYSNWINGNSLSLMEVEDALWDENLEIIENITWFNMAVVSISDDKSVEEVISYLQDNDNIEYAEPVYYWYKESINTNDSYAGYLRWLDNQWQIINNVQWMVWEDIDRVKMRNTFSGSFSITGPGSVVWVTDEGVNYDHSDLADQMRNGNTYHWRDFFAVDEDPKPRPTDNHWTHVAWTIAAKVNNWKWIIWVNPNTKIMSLRVMENGKWTSTQLINAIRFAIDNNVKIINASMGFRSYVTGMYDAIDEFKKQWWIFVTSAWNEGDNNDIVENHYPSNFNLDNIIAVAATTQTWDLAYFSNYWSTTVDVWAPWVNILSTSVSGSYNAIYSTIFWENSFSDLTNAWFHFYPGVSSFEKNEKNNLRFKYGLTPDWAYVESPSIDISQLNWNTLWIYFSMTCENSLSEDKEWLSIEVDTWAWYNQIKKHYTGTSRSYLNGWTVNTNTLKYRMVFHKDAASSWFNCRVWNVHVPGIVPWPDGYYEAMDWTSMASPHVAWLVSLVWMFKPDLTYTGVIKAIMDNWDTLPSLNWKTVSWKRINAYNTLAALDDYPPSTPTLTYPANWHIFGELEKPTFQRTASTDKWLWVSGYVFQLSDSSSFSSLITEKTVNTTQYYYENYTINPTGTYYWRVRAFDTTWNMWDWVESSFGYHVVSPEITISWPESWWKKSKSVSADVVDDGGVTTMWYAISTTSGCNSSSLNSSYTSYTKWSSISLNSESYNDKYVCFKAENNWWTTYKASAKISQIDNTPPVGGSFKINSNAIYTTGKNVILNVTCPTDALNGSVYIAYWNSENPTNWTSCSSSINWTLSNWDWTKTVYMRFKDGVENITSNITDNIILDTTDPVCWTWSLSPSTWTSWNVTATLSNSTDATAGIQTAWWDCTISSYNGTCSVLISDKAWNTKSCKSQEATNIDKNKPVITLSPTSWWTWKSHSVTLTVTENGASWLPASQTLYYRWQTSSTCSTTLWDYSTVTITNTAWASSTTKAITKSDLNGSYYLCILWWKIADRAWNTADALKEWLYIFDNTAPSLSFADPVSATYVKSDTITVNWWDASIKKYAYINWDCPTTSSNYTTATSADLSQTTQTNNWKYICLYAEDTLGNSTILKSENTIHVDVTAPVNWTFKINNDATYTTGTNVILNTTCATDELNWKVYVAYGTSTSPTNWTGCSSNINFTLPTWDWTKTIYMRFKDGLDNTTSDITDTIILDTSVPAVSANNYGSWKTSDFTITLNISDTNNLNYSKYSRTSASNCISNWISFTNWTTLPYNTEWTSTLYLCIEDKAWNTNSRSWTYKLDKTVPSISFDKQSWAIAKNHSVIVTISDSTSKLAASQKIKYKWSTTGNCWTDWFTEKSLSPTVAGTTDATATITTEGLKDWSYYLCILAWTVSDQAWNKNIANKTPWVFILDNTPPTVNIQYSAVNICTSGNISINVTASDNGSWLPTSWYSWNDTSNRWNQTWITLTENWSWTIYVRDNVWNITWAQYNVTWIDKTSPNLQPLNVSWAECSPLTWGVIVHDALCWASNISYHREWFWSWSNAANFVYTLTWVWVKTWTVTATDWAWNESVTAEVVYTWTDTKPTLEFPNYWYNTQIKNTWGAKIWNVAQLLWASDWACWYGSWFITATAVSCTSWSGELVNNELFVYVDANPAWTSICTITFMDDENNVITWNLAYNYDTNPSSWWGGWGWGWGWWWGWSSKSWIEKVIDMKELIHEDDDLKKTKDDADKDDDYKDISQIESDSLVTVKVNDNNFRYLKWNQSEILENGYNKELNNAYHFAYMNGITTMNDIKKADMYWSLNRISMAKMLSQYAIKVLWRQPDTFRHNTFWDVSSDLDTKYNNWVTLAYQLWIMWQNMPNNLFRPYDLVTRGEFGTALSRLLYWISDWSTNYYSTHLDKLFAEWIISNKNPDLHELRWYVMLMLMRSTIK